MKPTNEQLGRIARELRNHNRHTTQTVLIDAIDGRLDDAIETVTYTAAPSHGLLAVLREVAAELAEARDRVNRQCVVSAWDDNGVHRGTTSADGKDILDAVVCRIMIDRAAERVSIVHVGTGIEWTWTRGGDP